MPEMSVHFRISAFLSARGPVRRNLLRVVVAVSVPLMALPAAAQVGRPPAEPVVDVRTAPPPESDGKSAPRNAASKGAGQSNAKGAPKKGAATKKGAAKR